MHIFADGIKASEKKIFNEYNTKIESPNVLTPITNHIEQYAISENIKLKILYIFSNLVNLLQVRQVSILSLIIDSMHLNKCVNSERISEVQIRNTYEENCMTYYSIAIALSSHQ